MNYFFIAKQLEIGGRARELEAKRSSGYRPPIPASDANAKSALTANRAKVASIDCAASLKKEADYSVLTIWGVFQTEEGQNKPGVMLVDAWNKRLPIHGSETKRLPHEEPVPGEARQAKQRKDKLCASCWQRMGVRLFAATRPDRFRWWGILEAGLGALAWTLFPIAISFILAYAGIDVVEIFKRVSGK